MKKRLFVTLIASLTALQAYAFQPELNIGGSPLTAVSACADLGLKKGAFVSVDSVYTRLTVTEHLVNVAKNRTILDFSVPKDGTYKFEGEIGLQETQQFKTNDWAGSGRDSYYITGNVGLGSVTINHYVAKTDKTMVCQLELTPFNH